MHHWHAKVTVTGVPRITDEEMEDALGVVKGVIQHTGNVDELLMVWRFTNSSPDIWDAIGQAASVWRTAVAFIESAVDPACTDFHVRRVWPEEETAAEAELKKIFKE